MTRLQNLLFGVALFTHLPGQVLGHARLLNPPSRASKWRMGFSMPAADYDDNQGYCGGRSRLWNEFKGKCGVCGDAFYPIPRAHERGGRYYSGEITKTYKQGDIVEADVEVTANHRGWFEFRICPYDNPSAEDVERTSAGQFVEVTQKCLDKHPIPLADGSGYRYELPSPWKRGIHTVKLRLPFNLVCNKCLFQWKYNTGNSWGKSHNGSDCMGCGHQEQFYSCSDVKITSAAHGRHEPPSTRWVTPSVRTTWAWDRSQLPGRDASKPPSFWARQPGSPGWRRNPDFPTTTPTSPSGPTPRSRFWPWWFFDKNAGWFNRDVWATSTVSPTVPPTEGWGDWTYHPQTTRMPFWNRWFLDQSTTARNIPLVPKKQAKPKKKGGFWERIFKHARQNFWSWFFNGRRGWQTAQRKPKPIRRTTTTSTTTTTTTPRPTTPWWKWWENNRQKTTPAPKYRTWWESWPWARVWDKTSDNNGEKSIKPRPRWQSRSKRPRYSTRTTTTRSTTTTTQSPSSWEDEDDWHNNDMEYDNSNQNLELSYEGSSEVAQDSGCHAVGIWTTLPGIKQWCLLNCAAGFCPVGYCSSGCRD